MRSILLAASLILACGALRADSADGALTWGQAAAEALANNPSLKEARLALSQAEQQVTIADAGLYPSLVAEASLDRGSSDLFSGGHTYETPNGTYQGGLQASWNLFNGFATLAARSQAQATVQARQASYDQASSALYEALGQACNQLLYDQNSLVLLQSLADRYHADTLYQEQEFNAGLAALWTYEKTQSDEAGVVWQVSQQKYTLAADQAALAALLGHGPDGAGSIGMAGALTVTSAPEDYRPDLQRMLKSNPTLQGYRDQLALAQGALWQSQSTRYPSLSANGSWGASGGEQWGPDSNQWQAGLSLSYQLFSGGGLEAAITQANLAVEQARVTLADQEHDLQSALLKAWTSYAGAVLRLPSAEMAVKAGVDRFDTVGALYQAGREAYLDYEQAESIYSGAQTQQLSNLLSAAQSQLAYRNAAGITLEEAAKYPAP